MLFILPSFLILLFQRDLPWLSLTSPPGCPCVIWGHGDLMPYLVPHLFRPWSRCFYTSSWLVGHKTSLGASPHHTFSPNMIYVPLPPPSIFQKTNSLHASTASGSILKYCICAKKCTTLRTSFRGILEAKCAIACANCVGLKDRLLMVRFRGIRGYFNFMKYSHGIQQAIYTAYNGIYNIQYAEKFNIFRRFNENSNPTCRRVY